MSSDKSTTRGRIGGAKSKTGCGTCKVRRVKCDEEKPHCNRCVRTGRRCDGYSHALALADRLRISLASPATVVSRVLPDNSAGTDELRAFDYFQHVAAIELAGTTDRHFWSGTVLQLSWSDPVVWNAIISISSLYEHSAISEAPSAVLGSQPQITSRYHRQAVTWYNKAISEVRARIRSGRADRSIILLSCVLFVCVELLQDNVLGALELCRQGSELLNTWHCCQSDSRDGRIRDSSIANVIIPVVSRLQVLMALWGYPPTSINNALLNEISSLRKPCESNTWDARSRLYALAMKILNFCFKSTACRQGKPLDTGIYEDLWNTQQALDRELSGWYQWWAKLHLDNERGFSGDYIASRAILHMFHATLFILVSTALSPFQSSFDHHIHVFQRIIRHATSAISATTRQLKGGVLFFFEMGVIPPLYFTAVKCRNQRIRRQALSLLRITPRKEGLWKSVPDSRVAEKVIELEGTEGLPSEQTMPEERKRVHDIEIRESKASTGETSLMLAFTRRHQAIDGSWITTDGVVPL